MAANRISTFWIPLVLSIAFLLFGLAIPAMKIEVPAQSANVAFAIAALLVVLAYILSRRDHAAHPGPVVGGGAGGEASVVGNDSDAMGGDGGAAGKGMGGAGGKANVHGNNSLARGGSGGRG